jgi:protein-glucosylgalactosylhydroxylysine glucosidase
LSKVRFMHRLISIALFCLILLVSSCKRDEFKSIDRLALVTRHNITLNNVDTLGSLSVGNGEFAFTVDASGLQTFYQEYENGISLGTMSQWAWHRTPNTNNYKLKDVLVNYPSCDSSNAPYPIQHKDGLAKQATDYLRANPHRLHLGIIGLKLLKSNGDRVAINDLQKINQTLDLWTGKIESTYEVEGVPVKIILYAHQEKDQIAVDIQSKLISAKRLSVELKFPYGKECHVCPGYDFNAPDKHSSTATVRKNGASIERTLDSTTYFANIAWTSGQFTETAKHQFELTGDTDHFSFSVSFTRSDEKPDDFKTTELNSIWNWKEFWLSGGAIDFSDCKDPRAFELERRVILSQYLTKIQCSGSLPPQETGLTFNSWYGKFHMEMYWWHGAHYPLWNRSELLAKSMDWYQQVLEVAKATATLQGYKGARWQKMTDPEGAESPSSVGAFIIWQQPHPIYLAHLLYRSDSSKATLNKYQDVVFSTADFMTSFLKKRNGKYHLCHPLIPAQEIFKATETDDPAYELQYWHYALSVAQQWREMLGMKRNMEWEEAINTLAPLAVKDELYLPNATTPDAYTQDQYRKDHPAVLGAYGFLPYNSRVDTTIMLNTFNEIMKKWDWESTWGWDYPLMAMTATRLHKPELAIDALLMETQKNTYLINGHNYQDKRLRLYLPGNGGLLAAMALMTAGWDGNTVSNPGFPKNGRWNVRWEGIRRSP